jgi:predicted AlkP superfamily phosphohydrolase/phosphomutase
VGNLVSRPVLLIGIDGGTFEVLDPLLAAGELPVLAELLTRGTRSVLRSVVPPITPAAWSSFMTGKHPGKHGIYDFRVYNPAAYADTFVTSHALREPTLWQLLTAAGKRVAVVGLPMMYPPRADSGTIVAGFDSPSVASAFTNPPELRERILGRFPAYSLVAVADPADPSLERDATFAAFVADVERGLDQRTAIARELLAEGGWDVFMVHYQDVDALQHAAWRFFGDGSARAACLRAVYRRLDTCLDELLHAAPTDALVFLASDHGFGSHMGRLFPNALLRRWGYLDWHGRHRTRLRRFMARRLGRRATRADTPWDVQVREHGFARALPLVWRRTRAYVAVAEICALLYLNLRGREPEGVVAPGAEAERLIEELRERLVAVRDPRDGAPIFARVARGVDVYPDDRHGRRPELVLTPRPGYTIYRELRPRLWLDHHRLMAGTHRDDGILVAAGAGIRAGGRAEPASIVDVMPTVLAAAGVPIPDDVDGRVLAELFTEPPAVTYVPAAGANAADGGGLSAAEEDELARRLRGLGYMT